MFGEYLDYLNGRLDGNLPIGRNLCSFRRMDLVLYLEMLCRLSISSVIAGCKGRFVADSLLSHLRLDCTLSG